MEESEKMVALQKAYAEIILNTAKEAAARIMASERRALRFELDLKNTKDEAFRLLHRLKQMIDSKTKEAEITSLTKQRKIDELEAQLNEAEDVITDLRTELRWVRNKLEKMKSNQMHPPKEKNTHSPTSEPIIPSISNSRRETVITSYDENTVLNQRILDDRCCGGALQTENLGVCHLENHDDQKSNLASIIRSKEPELYRNECTQKTHALERNLVSEKLPSLGGVDGQHSLIKTESIVETSNKDVGKCTVPSPKTKNMDVTKRFSGEAKKLVKVRTLRRRKTRFGKSKANLRRSRPGQPIKPCHPSSVPSRSKTFSLSGNVKSEMSARPLPSIKVKACNTDNVKSSSVWDENLQHESSLNEGETMIIHKGKRNMKVHRDVTNTSFVSPNQLIKPCQTTSVVKHGLVYSFAIRGNVKSGEGRAKITENEAKMKPLPRLDPGLTLIKSGVNQLSTSVTVSVKALNKSRVAQDASEKDTELRIESTMVKPEGDAVENSIVFFSELNPDMVNVPVPLSDSKDDKSFSNGSPRKPDSNRFLKYTFHRKRKKESLSNSDRNNSPDKTTVKKRATEKPDDPPEPQKLSLINASSRDSRRLAQVARQLISLSGQRW